MIFLFFLLSLCLNASRLTAATINSTRRSVHQTRAATKNVDLFYGACLSGELESAQHLFAEASAATQAIMLENFPLYEIVKRQDKDMLYWLLVQGAGFSKKDLKKLSRLARSRRDHKKLDILPQHILSEVVDIPNSNKETPLNIACQESHVELGLWLVQHGANPLLEDDLEYSALYWACSNPGSLPILQAILEKAKQEGDQAARLIANHSFPYLETPLTQAVGKKNPEAVRCLLAYGADPRVQDEFGFDATDLPYIYANSVDDAAYAAYEAMKKIPGFERRSFLQRHGKGICRAAANEAAKLAAFSLAARGAQALYNSYFSAGV